MKKEINNVLGERVRTLRKAKGYTREVFAEKISVSTRFLAELEGGNVGVSISTLRLIALQLDISTDYLIGITNPEDADLETQTAINKITRIDKKHIKKINTILDCLIDMTET